MGNADVIIIGNGLIGSMTAHYFNSRGIIVTIIDSSKPLAASKCSFGVWKEGWINEKIQPLVDKGLWFLDDLVGIEDVEFFDMKKEKTVQMKHVDCSKIIYNDIIPGEVINISGKKVTFEMDSIDGAETYILEAKRAVIIAAGAYTDTLLNKCGLPNKHNLDIHWGATLSVNLRIEENRIQEWAPYKQNVLLKTDDENFVFGDGASVKNPQMLDKRIEKVSSRLITHLHEASGAACVDNITSIKEGWRPYLKKDDKEYIKQHGENIFSATGGAKNTTILCPYIAIKLFEKIILQK